MDTDDLVTQEARALIVMKIPRHITGYVESPAGNALEMIESHINLE